MDSAMISKIEKSKRYAEEPERIHIEELTVRFEGEHDTYTVTYHRGKWGCNCHFFSQRGVCSHTMTLERVFGEKLSQQASTEES